MFNNDIAGRKTPVFVMHAGSRNHGCEAIVESLLDCMGEPVPTDSPILVTNSADEDMRYSLGERVRNKKLVLIEENHIEQHFFAHVAYYAYRKITKDAESFLRYRFKPLFSYLEAKGIKPEDVIIYAIGGDNYCYPAMVNDLILANSVFHKKGFETVLLGCSIEPDSLPLAGEENPAKDKVKLLHDLQSYARIIARESVSYNALKKAGIPEENLLLAPDPAFTLRAFKREEVPLPEGFIPRKTIGLNVSPMVQEDETKPGLILESYRKLIKHIIEKTNAQIALIPHVVWERNDDRIPLQMLYDAFKDTDRVCLVEDMSAPELKYIISQCSLFVGARTHATIAAYSSAVPALVIGYSVKSRGIAKDLFARSTVETMTPHLPAPFVLPVQQLKDVEQLIAAFDDLLSHAIIVKSALEH